MGLLFIDGFDHEASITDLVTKWSGCASPGAYAIDSTVHAFTGASLKLSNISGGLSLFKTFPALGRVIVGVAVNPTDCYFEFYAQTSPPGFLTDILLFNYQPGTQSFNICLNGNFNSPIGNTGTNSVPSGVWSYVEFDCTFSLTAGIIKVNVNGSNVVTLTGVAMNSATCQSFGVANDTNTDHIDDLYILDPSSGPYSNPIGPARVQTLAPSANDAVQWTPNGAAQNFNNVNAIPFSGGGTDFNSNIQTNTGFQDTFAVNPLPSNPTGIFAVAVTSAFSESIATGDNVSNVLKSGAVTVAGTSFPLDTTYKYDQDIFVTDPNTSASWTVGGVNAAKIGYKQD